MDLAPLDWAFIVGYVLFALAVGLFFTRRASQDVDQYFLSGRSLPWWIAGTSMVATTFASDTPLVITGWVRDVGIWQNWLWWCTAAGGMLSVFLFARYWRRGLVMTTAELSELRYGGREASVLRGFLGVYQALITNVIILCWVMLAAAKIMDVLFDVDRVVAVSLAAGLALSYSLLAGFWGVVVTDLVQFTMAMVGSIALAAIVWGEVGGTSGVLAAAAEAGSSFGPDTLSFFPAAGDGGLFDATFWTVNLVTICVLMGVQWWAYEYVDGGILAVQRISASKSERDGMLAMLWYNVAHFALRPWPWILVALASLVVLPTIEIESPVAGTVVSASDSEITIAGGDGVEVQLLLADMGLEGEPDWAPVPLAEDGDVVRADQIVARTDSERAYVVMMKRYLPVGLLGLVVASLLAAFMSTVDTHVNLASSFFVNDIYRRFLRPAAGARHYVTAARLASVVVLALAGVLATKADSISNLFTFFMAFLSGVGPVYVLRWVWWRVRASTEITAILSSSIAATWLTFGTSDWSGLGPFAQDGVLTAAGRLCLVVAISLPTSLLSLVVFSKPDPRRLVEFYRRVRPIGWWGPVRELCPDVERSRETGAILSGAFGGLLFVYGVLFATGGWFLGRNMLAVGWGGFAVAGAVLVGRALRKLETAPPQESSRTSSST